MPWDLADIIIIISNANVPPPLVYTSVTEEENGNLYCFRAYQWNWNRNEEIYAHANFAFIIMSKNLIGFRYHPPEEEKKWRTDVELQDLVRYRIQFNEDIESKWMLSGILTGVDMGSGEEEVSSGLKWCPNNIPLEMIRRDGETIKLKNSIKSSALVWGICPKIHCVFVSHGTVLLRLKVNPSCPQSPTIDIVKMFIFV